MVLVPSYNTVSIRIAMAAVQSDREDPRVARLRTMLSKRIKVKNRTLRARCHSRTVAATVTHPHTPSRDHHASTRATPLLRQRRFCPPMVVRLWDASSVLISKYATATARTRSHACSLYAHTSTLLRHGHALPMLQCPCTHPHTESVTPPLHTLPVHHCPPPPIPLPGRKAIAYTIPLYRRSGCPSPTHTPPSPALCSAPQ
jgi:hypothetical protein